MSLTEPPCTCSIREHACSLPCQAHPEFGGGLGNPGWCTCTASWAAQRGEPVMHAPDCPAVDPKAAKTGRYAAGFGL